MCPGWTLGRWYCFQPAIARYNLQSYYYWDIKILLLIHSKTEMQQCKKLTSCKLNEWELLMKHIRMRHNFIRYYLISHKFHIWCFHYKFSCYKKKNSYETKIVSEKLYIVEFYNFSKSNIFLLNNIAKIRTILNSLIHLYTSRGFSSVYLYVYLLLYLSIKHVQPILQSQLNQT